MKYKIIILAILFHQAAFCQGVSQSAEGKSTILLEGTSLGIDITEAELSLSFNTLNKLVVERNKNFFLGADIRAKNAKGIGKLFSNSEIAPQGSLNFYLGHYWTNAILPTINSDAYSLLKTKLISEFGAEIRQVIERNGSLISDFAKRQTAVNNLLAEAKDYLNGTQPILRFPSDLSTDNSDSEIKSYREVIKRELTARVAYFNDDLLAIARRRAVLESKFNSALNYYRITWFLFGGLNGIAFKKFKGVDPVTFANSFEEVGDRGGQIGAGINGEWKRIRLGITYAYKKTNNFSTLSSAEFSLKEVATIGQQTLTTEEKVTAYKGTYGEVDLNEFNIDLIYNLSLNKAGSHFLLLNPYLRSTIFSRDITLLPNKTDLGAGFYFYKKEGNFLGGFYVELPDVNNNFEKRKPSDEQKIRPPLRKLSFGIITKISFNSILAW